LCIQILKDASRDLHNLQQLLDEQFKIDNIIQYVLRNPFLANLLNKLWEVVDLGLNLTSFSYSYVALLLASRILLTDLCLTKDAIFIVDCDLGGAFITNLVLICQVNLLICRCERVCKLWCVIARISVLVTMRFIATCT
jgi:hypothetical protein